MSISKDSGVFLLERPAEKKLENGIIYVPEARLKVFKGIIKNCYRCSEEDEVRKPRDELEAELRQRAEMDRINGNIVFTGDYDENLHVYALAACETNGRSLEGITGSGDNREKVLLSAPEPRLILREIPNYYDFDEPRTARAVLQKQLREELSNRAQRAAMRDGFIQVGPYFEKTHACGIVFNEYKRRK